MSVGQGGVLHAHDSPPNLVVASGVWQPRLIFECVEMCGIPKSGFERAGPLGVVVTQQEASRMPSFVPRSLEPYQKKELLEKRIVELQAAVCSGAGPARLSKAAEKVRSAALAVVKAKRAIIASHPTSQTGSKAYNRAESLAPELANLEQEYERWSSLSVEEIVGLYTTPSP
jgi:hypothetical protein